MRSLKIGALVVPYLAAVVAARMSEHLGESVCRASYEAVLEQEEMGDSGCPVCGRSAEAHYSERYLHQRTHDHDWKRAGLDSWRCECGARKTAIV